ncbi:unnamed protein product [Vicia faba]|uniref:Uncharacterized protein n=1 Tax=Vicia faba TaxID=3906 RepID=A0AAV0YVT8_VICFA|nr:unnamed protein product [Vicia faba]
MCKLKRLMLILKEINRDGYNNIYEADLQAAINLEESQEALKKDPLNNELIVKEAQDRSNYSQTHKAYCQFLAQKAKIQWLKAGSKMENRRKVNSDAPARPEAILRHIWAPTKQKQV